ncbi:DsbA family protein [Photobacterium swingsii]|uniref:DsbA family protein n=1 Tax=Photobacterium swingsii TaxID=680026 RepID=UPI00406971A1
MKNQNQNQTRTKITLIFTFILTVTFSPLTFAKTQQEKIEDINAMLQANPEIIDVLYDNLNAYFSQEEQFKQVLRDNHDYIYNNPDLPSFGASDPKLTIVVLTDFSCPWCKKLDPVVERIVKENPNDIKVIHILVPLKEMYSSANSTTFALNVWKNARDKFDAVNKMLISKPGLHDARSIMTVAKANGVEQYVAENAESTEMAKKNYQLFNDLGVRGTPAMLIDDQLLPGYLPYEQLAPMVEKMIAEKSK